MLKLKPVILDIQIYPLLAAMYIEEHHVAPPVLFDELLKMDLPSELRSAIDELLEIKKKTTPLVIIYENKHTIYCSFLP